MKSVSPKVFFLAQPELMIKTGIPEEDDTNFIEGVGDVYEWLHYIGGEEAVECLDHVEGRDIEKLIELFARRCYKSFAPGLNPNVTKIRTDSDEYHANIAKQRHGSVVANGGMVAYAFEGVSRVFTHEIVRNVIGTERSQESLRYVRLTDIGFWIPPTILNAEERMMLTPPSGQTREMSPADLFEYLIGILEWGQKTLAQMFDIENIKDFTRKKHLTSAFRRVAPIGLGTGIGMNFNLRALRWIIEQRTDPAAEEEIRLVFGLVAEHAMHTWPKIFQDVEVIDTGDGLKWYKPKNSKI